LYLKNITLRGFKSFAKKSNLVFEPGVCVIVGPNGSGKSNIVDAISWVMGEQSAKSLRGSSMEDVIFRNKNEEYAIAEVSLLFDNADKFLPLEFNEVKFTRRVFQRGGSEYFMNSSPCRLSDILDITSESGIGKGLYTVVNQGQIDDIALLKPLERKMVIDEILGIAKHKIRREKSRVRLDRVKDDIDRINDLMSEVKRTLDPLELESKKAQVYFEVLNNLKEEEIALFIHELNELNLSWESENSGYEKQKEKIAEFSLQIDEIERERAAFESKHEEKQTIFQDLRADIEAFSAVLNSIDSLVNLSASKKVIFNAFSNMFSTEFASISKNSLEILSRDSAKDLNNASKAGPLKEAITIISENLERLEKDITSMIKDADLAKHFSGLVEKIKSEVISLKKILEIEMQENNTGKNIVDINNMQKKQQADRGTVPVQPVNTSKQDRYAEEIKKRLDNIEKMEIFCRDKAKQAERFLHLVEILKQYAEKGKDRLMLFFNDLLEEINNYNTKSSEYIRKINELSSSRQNIDNELFRSDFRKGQIKDRVKDITEEITDNYNLSMDYIFKNYKAAENIENSKKIVRKLKNELKSFGNVNPNATTEYKRVKERYDFLNLQKADLDESRKKLEELIKEINNRVRDIFNKKFEEINSNFRVFFKSLFPLGTGEMNLVKDDGAASEDDDFGIELSVDIGNNKMISLSLLSGGEKALVSIAFLFSIFATNNSPFYVFDEIDAALDEMNLNRFTWLVKKFSEGRQVLIITHQKKTMEIADSIYGVTMQSNGVSKIVSEKVGGQDAEIN